MIFLKHIWTYVTYRVNLSSYDTWPFFLWYKILVIALCNSQQILYMILWNCTFFHYCNNYRVSNTEKKPWPLKNLHKNVAEKLRAKNKVYWPSPVISICLYGVKPSYITFMPHYIYVLLKKLWHYGIDQLYIYIRYHNI